ncbi:MAG: hypothetical protein Q4G45_12775 [Actinomycetia bacterium]|nr:hypothetical protein [Actinomycetes bacterium]
MTTMMSDDRGLHVGMVTGQVWESAVEKIVAATVPRDDPDELALWEATGILAGGKLDPGWGQAISIAQTATTMAQLVSVYQEVMFSATVWVARDGRHAVTATTRSTIETDDDSSERVDQTHPLLEVAAAPTARLWDLLRRVLPPVDELRHEPRPTSEDEARRVVLDPDQVPAWMRTSQAAFSEGLPLLPQLPAAIRDALEPRARVHSFVTREQPEPYRVSQHWLLGKQLHLVDEKSRSMWTVPPGALAHALVTDLDPRWRSSR